MMEFIIGTIGYFLIWTAVEFGRTPECKTIIFSKNWFIQAGLILVGVFLATLKF